MSKRKEPLVSGEYYHIYNRGVDKRDIFCDPEDVDRFSESIYLFNQLKPTGSIRDQREIFGVKNVISPDVSRLGKDLVEIVSFCFLPNHFHILLKQKVDGGISEFMKRITGGYTKYFNDKYDRSGSLFQGVFKSSLCGNDLYFKLVFCYVSFNFNIHNISKGRMEFVKSSIEEYVSRKFFIINEKEADFVLSLFGNLRHAAKYAKEIIFDIRKRRGKNELNDEDFKIE